MLSVNCVVGSVVVVVLTVAPAAYALKEKVSLRVLVGLAVLDLVSGRAVRVVRQVVVVSKGEVAMATLPSQEAIQGARGGSRARHFVGPVDLRSVVARND